jgi:hypothetical protein
MSSVEIFDNKVLKVPFIYHGERMKWNSWSVKMRGYIGGVSVKMKRMMELAAKHTHPIVSHENWDEEQVKLDNKMYSILTSLTEDDALDIIENNEGFGLEGWRLLCKANEPRSIGHNRTRLGQIIEPKLPGKTWMGRTSKWEKMVREYETIGKEKLSESIKMGVLQQKLCPDDDVKKHLTLNANKFTSYAEMKEEIESYVLAREGLEDPMEITFIGPGGWN